MFRQRPIHSFLVTCLLTLALVCGAALPSPWLWQCRHATRVVASPSTPVPDAMPCHSGGAVQMGMTMACCRPHAPVLQKSHAMPRDEPPPCHPVLVPVAALPAATLHGTRFLLHRQLSPVTPFPASAPAPFRVAMTTPQQQRPPPGSDPPSRIPLNARGPRAPPLA